MSVAILPLFSVSCQKEGSETLVLPVPQRTIPDSVIALDIQDSMQAHGFVINEGVFNSEILDGRLEGRYKMSPMVLAYASDEYVNNFYDLTFEFSNQKQRGFIEYFEIQQDTVYSDRRYARLIGHDSSFTMYSTPLVTKLDSRGDTLYWCKLATAISGIVQDGGLKNCQYSYVVLDKWGRSLFYSSQVPEIGTYRIWNDGDSLAHKL